ncbi:hypothetical protein BYT27DRAFT_7088406 [Phlegmacium glaucopus]|nr:hypothetical protein BYT27DRAFT_7088406 [Phlegmacium glaucopus]
MAPRSPSKSANKRNTRIDESERAKPKEAPKKVYDSDDLDEDSDDQSKKRKRASPKKNQSPRKKARRKDEDENEEYEEVKEDHEIVGVVVQAPETGQVPPGQISQNTLDFLTKLKDPACNDREWYFIHTCLTNVFYAEPVYRQAEQEWKDFIEAFTDVLAEVDPEIPHLPPKDVIYRIYRDVRFSNDKTPYKKDLSATFSRSGRKGIFAAFKPGNESIIGAGSWCPNKNELATIRSNIQRNSRRLRSVISAPEFVELFGKAKPHPQGERQNIFGMEDELKVAPKGIPKDHKDIDLLKCRSFIVTHQFTDSEVLAPDFKEKVAVIAKVLLPFVHCLNDLMAIAPGDPDSDDADDDGNDENTAIG